MQNMLETLWPTIIGWIMVLCGGCFALWRWIISQRVQRAQFLDLLIEKFKSIKYDDFLRRIESSYENSRNYDDEADDEVGAYDFLIFLSYVSFFTKNISVDLSGLTFSCTIRMSFDLHSIENMKAHSVISLSVWASLSTQGITLYFLLCCLTK